MMFTFSKDNDPFVFVINGMSDDEKKSIHG